MPSWVTSPVHEKAIATLIEARRTAGLTQRDLAAKIGKPQSFVAKIELRERNLSVLEFIALVRALGAEPSELMKRIADDLPEQLEF